MLGSGLLNLQEGRDAKVKLSRKEIAKEVPINLKELSVGDFNKPIKNMDEN